MRNTAMKHFTISLLSPVLLTSFAIATAVEAKTFEVTPFQLVAITQDGYLQDRGIPRGLTFLNEVRERQITPTEIVQAGIDDGRLTAETIHNRRYLYAVDLQMRRLTESDNK